MTNYQYRQDVVGYKCPEQDTLLPYPEQQRVVAGLVRPLQSGFIPGEAAMIYPIALSMKENATFEWTSEAQKEVPQKKSDLDESQELDMPADGGNFVTDARNMILLR